MKKLLLSSLALVAASFCVSAQQQTMYVVGNNVNGSSQWDPSDFNVMTYNATDDVYVWEGEQLGTGFKMNNGGWSDAQYNISSNGSAIELGVPYSYAENSGNIEFADAATVLENPTVILSLTNKTVTVTAGATAEVELSFTLAGDFNSDNANDHAFALNKVGDVYTGTFSMPATFRFQVVMNGTNWYGSATGQAEDVAYANDVTLAIGTGYQNDFNVTGWTNGEELTFILDWDAKTVTLTGDAGAAVETIATEISGEEVIYNLQGVRVNNPVKGGIYIITGKKVVY